MRYLLIVIALLLLPLRPAFAFDYLEHSYFTDRACRFTQETLAARIERGDADAQTVSRYLALAVVCPNQWDGGYCNEDGYKRHQANLNRLEESGSGVSLTLGDFAALPDHISHFGPVRNLTSAEEGLVSQVYGWMSAATGPVGGIIEDVSEDACEGEVAWARVEAEIRRELLQPQAPPSAKNFSPISRAPVQRGPSDPAGAYSFDNPHYLDLVLRASHHFGDHAYGTWLGFHSAATDVASRTCGESLDFSAGLLEEIAEGLPEYEEIEWDSLPPEKRSEKACALLAERIRGRVLLWSRHAPAPLVKPVAAEIEILRREADPGLVPALTSLVFEGSGLHFLEDGLSAGHMRPSDGRRGLGEQRYDHDYDNRAGVSAWFPTAEEKVHFVAFGDAHLLGPSYGEARACANPQTPEELTDCLVQRQRGIVVSAAGASLLDWALGGRLFVHDPATVCPSHDPEIALICTRLPLAAPKVMGHGDHFPAKVRGLSQGSLPIVAPPFAYESLDVEVANDLAGAVNQLGISMAYFSALGSNAGWLTSYRIGFRTAEAANTFQADFSYGFHWRWAARFLVDAEPFVFAGLAGPASGRRFETGMGPRVGITALPEGWVKIPLALGVSYRLPIVLYGRDQIDIEGHWLLLSLGLAFM
jgi:hypothetical protein